MWDIKYRPLRFSDVLGQDGAVHILRNRLKAGTAKDTSYIFSGGHGQGKCVTGGTLVMTHQGLVTIESLMGPSKIDPVCVQVLQERGTAEAAYSYRGGQRETVRIDTRLGFELEGTSNHRIQVLAPSGDIEWRQLGDVVEGDYACIVRRGLFGTGADLSGFRCPTAPDCEEQHRPFDGSVGQRVLTGMGVGASFSERRHFTVPSEVIPEWGFLMGCVVGTGAHEHQPCVRVSCAEPDVQAKVLEALRNLGGEGRAVPDKPGSLVLRCCGEQFRAFLAFLGVGRAGIPWSVLASPKPVVVAFLQALFECAGTVRGRVLEVVTKSRELARQLQVVLLQFGIVARRFARRPGAFWRVRVFGASVGLFRQEIGFVSGRKRAALDVLVSEVSGRRDVCDVVPYQAGPLRHFYANLPAGARTRDTGHFFRARYGRVACSVYQVALIATEFRDVPEAAHFVRLHEAGYIFDPIVRIGRGESQVFDLNVPKGEMFAANGFMNHNTTLARILARAILCENLGDDGEPCNACDNCQGVLDETSTAFLELDAASNGTIDKIRGIVDELAFSVYGADRRIYLFDEAHRMSKDAQDVLLKPVEDKRMIAVLCTTEADKIRGTIRSRCEEHVIRRVPREAILIRMQAMMQAEQVQFEDDAILTVIDYCNGHIRDTINRLGTIAQMGSVTLDAVRENLHLGMVPVYYQILLALAEPAKAVELVDRACDAVVPDEVASGLAEAAMNSYRIANSMFASFTTVDRALADEIYVRYGASVVSLAEHFSRTRYATKTALLCDILTALTLKAAAPQRSQIVVTVPTIAEAQSQGAAPPTDASTVPRGPHVRADGVGPIGEDPRALTRLDHKAVPLAMPRGHRANGDGRHVQVGAMAVQEDSLLPATEWRREFERLWPSGRGVA